MNAIYVLSIVILIAFLGFCHLFSEKLLGSLLFSHCLLAILILVFILTAGTRLSIAAPDLSAVEYLQQSDDYTVRINGLEKFVYKSVRNSRHTPNQYESISFVNFDLSETTSIEVTPKVPVSAFDIRPWSYNITGKKSGNTIKFTLNKPMKLLMVVNSSYKNVLAICANPPHTPPAPDEVTQYYGPGANYIGKHRKIGSGEKIYLAEGAVVEGSFHIQNASDVNIWGRGIITCGRWPHKEDFRVLWGDHTSDVTIEGITICNAPGWIISFWGGNKNLTVRNVKELGNYYYNTDGVQTGTENLLVEDCLFQCNDDVFSLNGVCRYVEIRDSIFWNIANGGTFTLGWGCNHLSDFNIHDCVIFRVGDVGLKSPFAMKCANSGALVENIQFKNIIVEQIVGNGRWINYEMTNNGTIRNISFENIKIVAADIVSGRMEGYSDAHPIRDIRFTNLNINGTDITDIAQANVEQANTQDIFFDISGKGRSESGTNSDGDAGTGLD